MASSEAPPVVYAHGALRRQRSVPAAVLAVIAPCGGAQQAAPRTVGSVRLGGKVASYSGGGEVDGEFSRFGGGGGGYYATSAAVRPGGGMGLVRALWRRIVRGSGRSRRRKVVMSRSWSSSSGKESYGHEEYAQNFDDGTAAREPENLARSFSARYAGRRHAGIALGDVAR